MNWINESMIEWMNDSFFFNQSLNQSINVSIAYQSIFLLQVISGCSWRQHLHHFCLSPQGSKIQWGDPNKASCERPRAFFVSLCHVKRVKKKVNLKGLNLGKTFSVKIWVSPFQIHYAYSIIFENSIKY